MNPIQADSNIDSIYLKRWSPRSFEDREVPEETLLSLFEAARWAPSGNNLQLVAVHCRPRRNNANRFINSYPKEIYGGAKRRAPVLALILSEAENEDGKTARFACI